MDFIADADQSYCVQFYWFLFHKICFGSEVVLIYNTGGQGLESLGSRVHFGVISQEPFLKF